MLHKTKGIVLGHIKYKETSIIVRIFTREFGVQSYVVNGVRTRNKGNKVVHYQPLSLLDLIVYYNEKKDLQRISEASFHLKYSRIPFDVHKSAIALFLAECLGKLLIDQEENPELFDFLESAFREFDALTTNFSEFHLYVLLHVLDQLGHSLPPNPDDVLISDLMDIKEGGCKPEINRVRRSELLHYIIRFYRENSQLSLNLKSLDVLESVFG